MRVRGVASRARRPARRRGRRGPEQRDRARLRGAARGLARRAHAQEGEHAEPDREEEREEADDLDRRLTVGAPHRCGVKRATAEVVPRRSPNEDGTRTVTFTPAVGGAAQAEASLEAGPGGARGPPDRARARAPLRARAAWAAKDALHAVCANTASTATAPRAGRAPQAAPPPARLRPGRRRRAETVGISRAARLAADRRAAGSSRGRRRCMRPSLRRRPARNCDANVEKDARGARGTQYSEYVFHTR